MSAFTSESEYVINLDSIVAARERIKDYIHITPVQTSETLNELARKNLYFKCEFMQKTGSFKARGACNAVIKNKESEDGFFNFVTHSSGNHAQALAWAAKIKGVTAYVVMPSNSPLCKCNAVANYGAIISYCEPTLQARESSADALVVSKNAKLIHAYNDPDVMSGQGTVALELLEQVPYLDGIIVPIGGGGLTSGITIAAKAINPNIKIIAAEPVAANDAYLSKQAGTIIGNKGTPVTIADGLRTNLGSNTWPIVRDLVDGVCTVDEDEIRAAVRLVYERMKFVIEPSAGVSVAVALSGAFKVQYPTLQHVGVILCGGNVDLSNLSAYI